MNQMKEHGPKYATLDHETLAMIGKVKPRQKCKTLLVKEAKVEKWASFTSRVLHFCRGLTL